MLNKVLHLQVDLMVCSHCWIQRPIKMACFELDVGVHTAQRQIPTQIYIGHLCRSVSMSSGLNTPQGLAKGSHHLERKQ